jgi:ribonuclease HI
MTALPGGSLTLYADGSSIPNKSGAGVVVLNPRGQVIQIINQPLPAMTNNEAEYAALSLALQCAAKLNAELVEIRMDSEVIVGQMTGQFAVHSPKLKQCHWEACELARQFIRVRYVHIPREHNALADVLATEASAGRRWSM